MESAHNQIFYDYLKIFSEYIDLDYLTWLWPILKWWFIWFLVPFLLAGALGLILHISKFLRYITHGLINYDDTRYWNRVRKIFAAFIVCAIGWIGYGYEVTGMEYIPETGPALIVYYHGVLPLDLIFLMMRLIWFRDRLIHSVVDRFFFEDTCFRAIGSGIVSEMLNLTTGTFENCVNVLKEGNLLSIAPGGAYEALFSHNYELLWKNRLGFAKVAIEAKVPIIPMFTENIRESYRTVSFMPEMFHRLYEATRSMVVPFYGGFPVKLRTHLGPPIEYDPALTPEQLQKKVALAIEDLIKKHQRKPGSIWRALAQRFVEKKKNE